MHPAIAFFGKNLFNFFFLWHNNTGCIDKNNVEKLLQSSTNPYPDSTLLSHVLHCPYTNNKTKQQLHFGALWLTKCVCITESDITVFTPYSQLHCG